MEHLKRKSGYFGCLLVSAVLITVCSKSSFLYPLNDWVDVNIYFTIGKGMMNGLVPYRDLFDQKGPVVFLLYGLCSLLSGQSFLGVWLAEILSFSGFLWFSLATLRLFEKENALLWMPLLGAATLTSLAFSHGGSLEEFCLFPFSYGLYSFVKYYRCTYPKPVPLSVVALNGLCAGMVMMSKFNLLAFYFAWMAVVGVSQLLIRRIRRLFAACGLYLAMMAACALPWLLYFQAVDGMDAFVSSYITGNLFGYSYLDEPTLIHLLSAILRGTGATLYRNIRYSWLILLGMTWFTFKKNCLPLPGKIGLWVMAVLTCCGIYCGGQGYRYYGIVLMVFCVLGLVPLASLFNERLAAKIPRAVRVLPALVTALSLCFCLLFTGNRYLMGVAKEETPQYRFASLMKEKAGGAPIRLLCRSFPDSGFYLAAGVLPELRFFTTTNVPMPEVGESQQAYIDQGKARFVVTRDREQAPGAHLILIDTASLYYEEAVSVYRLYQYDEGKEN